MKYFLLSLVLYSSYIQANHIIGTPLDKVLYHNYYWRDYNGEVPDDAISGGRDIDGETTYIGQALAFNKPIYGNIPTQILAGETTVDLPLEGVIHVKDNIKILCGSPNTAGKWISTNSNSFLLDVLDKHAVHGGVQVNATSGVMSNIYVGRLNVNEQLMVGKILVEDAQHVTFSFAHLGAENSSPFFEVLIYED